MFGIVTSLNDVAMRRLKELFALNYGEMTLVQLCVFTGFFLVSIPAAFLIERVGYLRWVVIGLLLMAVGYLLFSLPPRPTLSPHSSAQWSRW